MTTKPTLQPIEPAVAASEKETHHPRSFRTGKSSVEPIIQ